MTTERAPVPIQSYYPSRNVVGKKVDVYPIFIDRQNQLYFKETNTLKINGEMIYKEGCIVLKDTYDPTNKLCEMINSKAQHVRDNIKHTQSYQIPDNLWHGEFKSFYTVILPLYLEKKYKIKFVTDYEKRSLIWSHTAMTPKLVESKLSAIKTEVIKCSEFNLQNSEGKIMMIKNDDVNEQSLKNPVEFKRKLSSDLKYVIRKFYYLIIRDMKRYCVTCKEDLFDESKGPNNIDLRMKMLTFKTPNAQTQKLFNDQLEIYIKQILKKNVENEIPKDVHLNLTKCFNCKYCNSRIMLRRVTPNENKTQNDSVEILCLFLMYLSLIELTMK